MKIEETNIVQAVRDHWAELGQEGTPPHRIRMQVRETFPWPNIGPMDPTGPEEESALLAAFPDPVEK